MNRLDSADVAKQRRKKRAPQQRPSSAPGRSSAPQMLMVVAVVTAVGLAGLVYLNTLDNPFVYDDLFTVLGNPSIHHLENPLNIWRHDIFRPVVNLSYAIDVALWGLQPRGFHITSIFLHMANVFLLWWVLRRLAEDLAAQGDDGGSLAEVAPWAAVAGAALFAVHPILTEAVGYTSARSELLCTFFVLGSFLELRAFLIRGGSRPLIFGLLLFVLAALSKEPAAMLPFMLLAWDVLLRADDGRRGRLLRFHLPFSGTILVAGLLRVGVYLGVEQGGRVQDLWHNALVEVVVVWRYFVLLLFPRDLSVVHSVRTIESALDPAVIVAVIGWLGVAAALVWLARRRPLIALGGIWFLLLIAPSHVIPLQEAMAEHRVYTACIGFFLVVTAAVLTLAGASRAGRTGAWKVIVAVCAGVTLLAAGTTITRNRVWASPVSLWSDAALKAPDTWAPQYALADALRTDGRCQEAVPIYRRAIEILPNMVDSHLNLGICLAEVGHFVEAEAAFQRARELAPEQARPLNNLAILAARQGRLEPARDLFLAAIERDQANLQARQALVQIYEQGFQDAAAALAMCEQIQAISPATAGVEDCIRRNRARLP